MSEDVEVRKIEKMRTRGGTKGDQWEARNEEGQAAGGGAVPSVTLV